MRTNNIRRNPIPILGLLAKFVFAAILLVAFVNAAPAYTLVFRDGHRIEVPSVFTVTPATLTYEVAPGINKTVQLILIDVAATETANHEAPGNFFKHGEPAAVAVSPTPTRRSERTLTNRDLEPSRLRRIESEREYEKRRIELGLPSIEETRRRQALEEESTLALARERAAAAANDETYWRSRAGALRNEIITIDAEINYLRARLGPVRQFPLAAQSFVTGGVFVGRPFAGRFPTPGAGRMGTMAATSNASPSLTNTGAVALRPSRPTAGFGFPRQVGSGFGFPVLPFGYGDNSYDVSIRLNDLLQRRAGLEALWRELESEARIAKVPQVWLAP